MELTVLTLEMAQRAREWRNNIRETLRTPFFLTEKMQEDFYNSLNRNSNSRYWTICSDSVDIGMGGLVGIEWENRLAEISIILDPAYRKKGYGEMAVYMILNEGFNKMNLDNIYGECYMCNPAVEFWKKIIKEYGGYMTVLPTRKWWNGRYWDAIYFNFKRKGVLPDEYTVYLQ